MFLKINRKDNGIPKDKDSIILCRNRGACNIMFFPKAAGSQPGKSVKTVISRLVPAIMPLSRGQRTLR